jgi:hypothetical protein
LGFKRQELNFLMLCSPFARRFFRTFGSLKLAVVTLTALAVVLALATIYESKTSTRQVQALVYQSWWFITLLFALALSVFCSAMTRFPWKKSQASFVITHAGILVMLVGSIVGLLGGAEGSITILEGGPARNTLNQDFEVLQIRRLDNGDQVNAPLQLERHTQRPRTAQRLKTGSLPLQIVVQAAYANTEQELSVQDGGTSVKPAVRFSLSGQMGGGDTNGLKLTEWLIAQDPQRQALSFGPAMFRIEVVDSAEALKQKLQAPTKTVAEGKGVFRLEINGQPVSIPVAEYLGKEFKTGGGLVTVRLQQYYADFRMDTKTRQPSSASDQPNNPAIAYEVKTPEGTGVGFAFADFPEMSIWRSESLGDAAVKATYQFDRSGMGMEGHGGAASTFSVLVGPESQLHYVSKSPNGGFAAGALKVGGTVSTGWKMAMEVRIDEFYLRPKITARYVSAPADASPFPGLELEARQGSETKQLQLRWGEPKQLVLAGVTNELTYRMAALPLDFAIELKKFSAPKYEGTTMPAAYESFVRVTDQKTGEAFEKKIWMNHPMNFHGYRISQSGYEEGTNGEPNRSTLQLLRDPGSWLKWMGSILIMLGIASSFYINPHSVQEKPQETDAEALSPAAK